MYLIQLLLLKMILAMIDFKIKSLVSLHARQAHMIPNANAAQLTARSGLTGESEGNIYEVFRINARIKTFFNIFKPLIKNEDTYNNTR